MADPLRLYSWNVNGIRACARKGFRRWLLRSDADIVGLQEVRARAAQLPDDLTGAEGYHLHLVEAERPGYSGVALLSSLEPDTIETSLGDERFDREGRLQIARYGCLFVVNCYFPNGSGNQRDNGRVGFKLDFYAALFARVERERRGGKRVIVMGDFNTAHREVDLARPAANAGTSGFLPEERAEIDRWLAAGWVDAFRAFEDEGGHYTWWSQRQGARERNVGWRIDYALASPAAARFLRHAWHEPQAEGSDHCPIAIELDRDVLGSRRRV
jgi:exodeoxyribonuclease-3